MQVTRRALLGASLAALASPAFAQDRPITLVVGYGAGAAVTLVSLSTWRVQGAAGSESFVIIGAFDPAFDAMFG